MGSYSPSHLHPAKLAAPNPCFTCGACCAAYRVSFYWAEADPAFGGLVLSELTEQVTPFRLAMKGTGSSHPRCIALAGEIGCQVHCAIYENRPSICREFQVAWQDGQPSEFCDQARQAWGLPPLASSHNEEFHI